MMTSDHAYQMYKGVMFRISRDSGGVYVVRMEGSNACDSFKAYTDDEFFKFFEMAAEGLIREETAKRQLSSGQWYQQLSVDPYAQQKQLANQQQSLANAQAQQQAIAQTVGALARQKLQQTPKAKPIKKINVFHTADGLRCVSDKDEKQDIVIREAAKGYLKSYLFWKEDNTHFYYRESIASKYPQDKPPPTLPTGYLSTIDLTNYLDYYTGQLAGISGIGVGFK